MERVMQAKIYGVVFLAAVISCFIALYNNFPLLYEDTGSYIHSGFHPKVFMDRPIFYGLFLKIVSLSSSLWLVVLTQGLLICYLIFLTLGLFFEGFKRSCIFICSVTFLTFCTGFSYNVSILIPDIFSAIALLCLINLLLNKTMSILQTVFVQCLFIFSICTQFSSIPIMLMLFGIFFIYVLVKKARKQTLEISLKKLLVSCGLALSCLFIIPAVHYSYDKQFKISGANHMFIMNHLLEVGILEDYLQKECATHDYKICAFKDSLGWELLWSPNSPALRTGGWEANRKEYKAIILDVIKTPDYFKILAIKAVEFAVKQFFTFEVTVTPRESLTAPVGQIDWRFRTSLREVRASRQYTSTLNLVPVNTIQQFLVFISMVFLFVVLVTPFLFRRLTFELRASLVIFIIHNLINALMCSNFSTVHNRFQNRLAWLFPLFAIVIIFQLLEYKKAAKPLLQEPK